MVSMPTPRAQMTIARSKEEATEAYKAMTPEERAQVGADMKRGVDPIHAVNLVRSRRRQEAARTGSEAADTLEGPGAVDRMAATAMGAASRFGLELDDEAKGAALAVAAPFRGREIGAEYERGRDEQRAAKADLQDIAPASYGAGQLTADVAGLAIGGKGLTAGTREAAKLGGLGAAGGFGAGEGAAESLTGAAVGGGLGLAFGAGVPLALRLAPALGERASLAAAEDAALQLGDAAARAPGAARTAASDAAQRMQVPALRLGAPMVERAPLAGGAMLGAKMGGPAGAFAGGAAGEALLGPGASRLAGRMRSRADSIEQARAQQPATPVEGSGPSGLDLDYGTQFGPAQAPHTSGPDELGTLNLRMASEPSAEGEGTALLRAFKAANGLEPPPPGPATATPEIQGAQPAAPTYQPLPGIEPGGMVISAEQAAAGVKLPVSAKYGPGEGPLEPGFRLTPQDRFDIGLTRTDPRAIGLSSPADNFLSAAPDDLSKAARPSALPRLRLAPAPTERPLPLVGEAPSLDLTRPGPAPDAKTIAYSQAMRDPRALRNKAGADFNLANRFDDDLAREGLDTRMFDDAGNELPNPVYREMWRRAGARNPSAAEGGPAVDASKMTDDELAAHRARGNPTKGALHGSAAYHGKRNQVLRQQAEDADLPPEMRESAADLLKNSRTAPEGPQGQARAQQAAAERAAAELRDMPDEHRAGALAAWEQADPGVATILRGLLGKPRGSVPVAPAPRVEPTEEPSFVRKPTPGTGLDERSRTWMAREAGDDVIPETQIRAGERERAARVKGDGLPSDKGLAELLEANGINDADFARRDAFGPEIRESSLLEAWKKATRGARTWRDLEPHLSALAEALGVERINMPEHVRTRQVAVDVKKPGSMRMAGGGEGFPVDEGLEQAIAQRASREAAPAPKFRSARERWEDAGDLTDMIENVPGVDDVPGDAAWDASRRLGEAALEARRAYLDEASARGDIAFDEALEALRGASDPADLIRRTGRHPDDVLREMDEYAGIVGRYRDFVVEEDPHGGFRVFHEETGTHIADADDLDDALRLARDARFSPDD